MNGNLRTAKYKKKGFKFHQSTSVSVQVRITRRVPKFQCFGSGK